MKKILILGSDSMAGHIILNYLINLEKYEMFGLEENNFILYNNNFESKVELIAPDVIINTLRLIVDKSESSPEKAIYINSFLPKYFEKKYLYSNTKIIHLSTDCIFSGNHNRNNGFYRFFWLSGSPFLLLSPISFFIFRDE